jgi:hypothetical protein
VSSGQWAVGRKQRQKAEQMFAYLEIAKYLQSGNEHAVRRCGRFGYCPLPTAHRTLAAE